MSERALGRRITVRKVEGWMLRACLGAALASALGCIAAGHLLWNWTSSLPLGLYWLSPWRGAQVGALVAFPVPANVRAIVTERRYLPPGALLVKPVVAMASDSVCTDGGVLTVNGKPLGPIAT